jgi:hypothetical protein
MNGEPKTTLEIITRNKEHLFLNRYIIEVDYIEEAEYYNCPDIREKLYKTVPQDPLSSSGLF